MNEAWIIDACRTPRGIGKKGKGALTEQHPQHLGATVLRAIAERNDLNTADVGDVIFGTSSQRGRQSGDLARMSALEAGYDVRSSGMTLDRFCGSGITSVNLAAMNIMSGSEDLVIGGGAEMMSTYGEEGAAMSPFMDNGNLVLRDMHPQPHQGVCADAVASLEGIAREALDALAFESQQRAANAIANGHFDKSLVPVYSIDGTLALDKEEFPRPQTSLAGLAELKASFAPIADYALDDAGTTYRAMVQQKYPGLDIIHVHHAGNSSGIVDGAAAVLVGNKEVGERLGLKPRARLVKSATVGSEPCIMLTGPMPASRKALAKARMQTSDIDLWEINEAFSAVCLLFMEEMGIDHSVTNVNGGAIAFGHPLGATGAMLLGTMLDELERRDLNTALITLCVGAGMGTSTII